MCSWELILQLGTWCTAPKTRSPFSLAHTGSLCSSLLMKLIQLFDKKVRILHYAHFLLAPKRFISNSFVPTYITVLCPVNCVARKMWGIHDAVRAHKARRHFRVSLTSIQNIPKRDLPAVLPVHEKKIGVIAIVEMCEKCSHFRLLLAVEKMKIARPETYEEYFVAKENF